VKSEAAGDIVHDESAHRFVLGRDGVESYLLYRPIDPLAIDFQSTWVHPQLRGRGIGARLVEHGLQWAKARGVKIVPSCWFVAQFIDRNPQYRSLISSRA
jgi:predicted GNAT family acetyltransferase